MTKADVVRIMELAEMVAQLQRDVRELQATVRDLVLASGPPPSSAAALQQAALEANRRVA